VIFSILNILIVLLLPAISINLTSRLTVFNKLSPVFICYLVGIILANTPGYKIDAKIVTSLYEAAVMFAIPMLLYNVRLAQWPKVAKLSLLSFLLAVVSALVGASIVSFIFKDIPEVWNLSGMLIGIFVGGTANMQAIGVGLGVSDVAFVQLNAAEVACCGVYLLFLVSIAQKLALYFLPAYKLSPIETIKEELSTENDGYKLNITDILLNFLIAIVVILFSVGLTYLITGKINNPGWLIILITSLSLLGSTFKRINRLKGGFETGNYLLLMFCTGIGLMADFSLVIKDGLEILVYVSLMLLVIVIIHFFLSYLFKVDADNMIISSTATIFGPAFIGQIAAALKNKDIIFPGMVISMMGIGIANYLGISMAYLLKMLLGY